MTENLSPETLVGAAHVDAANGGGTVESSALSLADLNKHLGSDFKDVPTALKALKDTKDFVGRRKEDIEHEIKTSNMPSDVASKSDVQSLKNQLFLSQNPQYTDYVGLLQKINPSDLAEAVNAPEFKTVFEKVKVADEVVSNRSVVSSSSRLSQNRTVTDEAINIANARGTTAGDVAEVLARGIIQQIEG